MKKILLAILVLIATGQLFKHVMLYCQDRAGTILNDPIQALFEPLALHLPIFVMTYAPILLGVVIMVKNRNRENLIYAYCILQVLRMTSIYLVPLEPPPQMITLKDPIADVFVFGTVVTKDLFFSGHVSALTLFSFYMPNRRLAYLFRFCAAIDAILLTVQNVHYTADVAAAPIFAYAAYRMQVKTRKGRVL